MEKEMATHSSILAWEIPWTEEPGGYSPWSCKESETTQQLSTHSTQMYRKKAGRGGHNRVDNHSLQWGIIANSFPLFTCLPSPDFYYRLV